MPLWIAILCFLPAFGLVRSFEENLVDYYVDLIAREREKAKVYELPEDAREYEFDSSSQIDFGEFDYVIVGAGSAGSVVANRLSEVEFWNVLVLEAGNFENNYTDIPSEHYGSILSEYNWGFKSVPQETACLGMVDRICPFPRGRGVGGSSIINGLVYSRGNPNDYDRWAAEGNPGWSYEEVLPYFKKSERFTLYPGYGDYGYHGTKGENVVERVEPLSPQVLSFLEANRELGYRFLDYNGAGELGASFTQVNTIHGRRDSSAKAFLAPALARKNLKVLTRSYATKILIDQSRRAYGVEFSYEGRRFVARARKEVVLSAGAISSPQILLLSGVGPKAHLQERGVDVVLDLPVGEELLDHTGFFGLIFNTNYSAQVTGLERQVRRYLKGVSPLTAPGNTQGIGFYRTKLARYPNTPDIEVNFIPANATSGLGQTAMRFTNETIDALYSAAQVTNAFLISVFAEQPLSKGTLRLKSKDPFEYPLIDPRYLSDRWNYDIETIYQGVLMVLEMVNAEPFRRIDARLSVKPFQACASHDFLSKDYWYCAIPQATMNVYHPMGTCKMGPDPEKGAVVDARLKVHGIKDLRVVDASVIPLTPACHTNAVAVMIAEMGSDFIKKDNLPAES